MPGNGAVVGIVVQDSQSVMGCGRGDDEVTVAATGIVLAVAWLAERTTLLANDPLNHVSGALIAHPFLVAGALAAVAAASWSVADLRHRDTAAARDSVVR